jgi:hypothetical protein
MARVIYREGPLERLFFLRDAGKMGAFGGRPH